MGVVYRESGASYGVEQMGGTSLACPLFTGMEALAVQASGSPLGFADPDLYKLYGTSQFRDVVPAPPRWATSRSRSPGTPRVSRCCWWATWTPRCGPPRAMTT
ncbi:hypothetical protein GXW82_40090 [Streptacidiphilus sp. 4-A2]|nr:hypothetical protein [Streptacidiphilus sp. 4-A2]